MKQKQKAESKSVVKSGLASDGTMELQSVLGSKRTAEAGDVVMPGCMRQVLDWGGAETAAFILNPA